MKRTANSTMRSRTNRSGWWEAFSTLLLLMSGCGNSSGSHQVFSTSVPPGTELKSLSSEQLVTLCRDLAAFQVNTNAEEEEFDCRQTGRLSAAISPGLTTQTEARAVCQRAYDRCKAGFPTDAGDNFASCTMTMVPANCTATIADLSACVNDLAASISSSLSQTPSCGTLTLSDLAIEAGSPVGIGPDGGLQGFPPACVTYFQKCRPI